MSDVARFPGALETVETPPAWTTPAASASWAWCGEALDGLVAMRAGEGGRLLPRPERALHAILERPAASRATRPRPARRGRAASGAAPAASSRSWASTRRGCTRRSSAGGASRRQRGGPAAAEPRRPWPASSAGAGALGQEPGLPGPGAHARGQHGGQQGRRSPRSRERWWGSRPRSRGYASRCRTLSNRAPSVIVVSGPFGAREVHHSRPGCCASWRAALLGLPHHAAPPRTGERDGVQYHFVTEARSKSIAPRERFLEWAEVYGQRYGTSRAEIVRAEQRRAWTCCWTWTCRARSRSAGARGLRERVHPAPLLRGPRAAAAGPGLGRRGRLPRRLDAAGEEIRHSVPRLRAHERQPRRAASRT